jgi:hypothetical protein
MKKHSQRERRLIRLAGLTILLFLAHGQWQRYGGHKAALRREIQSLQESGSQLTERLKYDKEALLREMEQFGQQTNAMQDHLLRMDEESEAQFRFQEDISKLGEKTKINMGSAAKRNSKVVHEAAGLVEIRTYFTFDCTMQPLIEFFEGLSQLGYFVAIDQLTMNSYSQHRSKPARGKEAEETYESEDKLRGTATVGALFRAGQPLAEAAGQEQPNVAAGQEPVGQPGQAATAPGEADSTAAAERKIASVPREPTPSPSSNLPAPSMGPGESNTRFRPEEPKLRQEKEDEPAGEPVSEPKGEPREEPPLSEQQTTRPPEPGFQREAPPRPRPVSPPARRVDDRRK